MQRKRLSKKEFIAGLLSHDRIVLSKAITLVESHLEQDRKLASEIIQAIFPHTGNSFRIGITGVPGVGKSTFIEAFGELLTKKGRKVAVLAIDPSSIKTGGSILGDKARMQNLANNPNVFIRPSAAGKTLGGVANATRETILLCEAAGFDFIIIETVGVGQSETLVDSMVDFFLLLMLAGAGDELQGIKKGIIEMAHTIVINKADGKNMTQAKKAKKAYENALHLLHPPLQNWQTPVYLVSALEKTGLNMVWETIQRYEVMSKKNGIFFEKRKDQLKNWFHDNIKYQLIQAFYKDPKIQEAINTYEKKIISQEIPPFEASEAIFALYKNK